jgi:hypothetical protein
MIPTKQRLISTVRALLEKTEARGCTMAEAAAARAKAFELMNNYGLSLNDLLSSQSQAAATLHAPLTPEASQKVSSDQRRTSGYRSAGVVYSSDAFEQEVLCRRRGVRNPFCRFASVVAGLGFIALACWVFGTFCESQDDPGKPQKAACLSSPSPIQQPQRPVVTQRLKES